MHARTGGPTSGRRFSWLAACPLTAPWPRPLADLLFLPACLQNISDEDVLALVNDELHAPAPILMLLDHQASALRALRSLRPPRLCPAWSLPPRSHRARPPRVLPHCSSSPAVQVMCGSIGTPTATVTVRGPDGVARQAAAMGSGPVDATIKALSSLSPVQCKLLDYSVSAVTGVRCMGGTTSARSSFRSACRGARRAARSSVRPPCLPSSDCNVAGPGRAGVHPRDHPA